MANHKSAQKRVRSDEAKRLRNRYQVKSTRTFLKKIRDAETQKEAEEMLPQAFSMLDRLAKRNIIHKKNADNKKSKLAKHVKGLA